MAGAPISATSTRPSPLDVLNQQMVKELVQAQQRVLVDYGKHLATVAFAAVGLVFTLSEKWLGDAPAARNVRLLGLAVTLYLGTAMLATVAAGVFLHRVSFADPGEVEEELTRVARLRFRLASAGFFLFVIATVMVALVALGR
jgi:hypothetical protein